MPSLVNQLRSKRLVPPNWSCKRIGEVLKSSQYGLNSPSSLSGTVPIVGMKDLHEGEVDTSSLVKIDGDISQYRSHILRRNDVLINRTNSYELVGKSAIYKSSLESVFASYLVRLMPDLEQIDPSYLILCLCDSVSQKILKRIATRAVSQANINPTEFKKHFPILLPPLAEQRKIAEILSTWDRAIETTERLLANATNQKRALMHQLLTGKLRFAEFGSMAALENSSPADWEDSVLGEVISSLDAGVSVNSSDRPAGSEAVGVLKTSCVSNGYFDPFENKIVDDPIEQERVRESAQAGSIILSRMNTPTLVGANGFVDRDYPNLFLPDRLWQLKIRKDKANCRWLGFWMEFKETRDLLSRIATGTSGSMKNITKEDVRALPISLPSLPEQSLMAEILMVSEREIDAHREALVRFRTEKKALMQQLLTGKRRVAV